AGQRTMQRSIAEELRVGSNVVDQMLAARGRQLSDTVRVLAADFAFREAVASGDRPTIESVLANHGSRIGADVGFLISLDGSIIAGADDRLKPVATSGIVSFNGKPYQLVVVPVLAPRPIARVCMGFDIDAALLNEVRRLTGLEVSLDAKPIEGYQSLAHPLRTADGSRITIMLRRSVAEAAKPYRRLAMQVFALSGIALIAALFAARFFARGVSRPLEDLAGAAQRIERGDYAEPIAIEQRDEIGRLATAFNRMRTAIAEREDQIRYQATHDALTGLPNRVLFLDRLSHAIAQAKRGGELVAMIMMDLDRFKEINDTLGHHTGDQLLKEIGRRLGFITRQGDTIARLGGDEFAITFFAKEPSRAAQIAQRIRIILEDPIVLGSVSIEVTASMGIALFPTHAEDAPTLMKRADVAMYDAKKTHGAYATYEPGRDEHSLRRLAILSELRNAIAHDELTLHYQPKIDVRSDETVHAEALVRWRHPVHGVLGPDEFIPLAEQSGNIGMITKWVLKRAIADCGEWNAAGLNLTVAVNLSALDLFDVKLPAYIDGLLADAKLPPSRLVLEITESAIMKDPAYALRTLNELKERGMTLAIDDYGTGYSSLSHLKRLPVDELKIDKSFVQNLREAATDDILIVRSTIELGHNMGLKVIAEGVENAEALRILKDLGCDMAQGYFVSPPLPLQEFREWFQRFAFGQTRNAGVAPAFPTSGNGPVPLH
ncbi:MAG TPA: EAL domain-containing protein, partial [Thermoanaerobaculia bacterium]